MKEKILWECFGGLGDCLQYSTLPEMFSKEGFDVYIKDDNFYRNPEIKKLVWETNPFVKGFKNGMPNCGSTLKYQNLTNNFIKNIEIGHDLIPTNDFPKIYININDNSFYKDKVFIDSNCISVRVDEVLFEKSVLDLCQQMYPDKEKFVLVFENNIGQVKTVPKMLQRFPIYTIKSIFHYCELIKNCYALICQFSGSAALASSIKQFNELPKIHVLIHSFNYNHENFKKKIFYFPNIQYIQYG